MEKYEYKKALKTWYDANETTPIIFMSQDMSFLKIDGEGAPNSSVFQNAVNELYGIAYSIKMGRKKEGKAPDFIVQPLEGLWWHPKSEPFNGNLDGWKWTLMIGLPDFIDRFDLERR